MVNRLVGAALLVAALGGSACAELAGAYRGIEAASGMRLEFSRRGEGYRGVLADGSGARRSFAAEPTAAGAEALIERAGEQSLARFTETGLGVEMIELPMGRDGQLKPKQARRLVFLRPEVEVPPRPDIYVEPPERDGATIDPAAFVDSYPFWAPEAVARGYMAVRPRYRTLIRFHAVVQTDIVWKMCQSQARPRGLAEALRGQEASCGAVLEAIGRAMRDGAAFNRFKADVAAERARLQQAIDCSIDYRRNDPACLESGRRVADAAVSLQTVGTVISRY